MNITHLKTNRIVDPLGFAMDQPRLSWVVEDTPDTRQIAAQIVIAADAGFDTILLDTGRVDGAAIDSLGYAPALALTPRTRYYWKVRVWGDTETAESAPAWFETAKLDEPWQAHWITPDFPDAETHPTLTKTFDLSGRVVAARAYVCGLGLYHLLLNGAKVGVEVLAPHCNAYDQWLQYQTYDLTDALTPGAQTISVMLGNGWYKGRYGMQEGPTPSQPYGDRFALIAELHLTFDTGEQVVIGTDETWQASPSPVLESGIYDGEVYDARIPGPGVDRTTVRGVRLIEIHSPLQARRSLPVEVIEELKPIAVLHTPADETVLDLGQNLVGWLRFKTSAPAGTRIHLQYGEVLQNGCFYNDNLRTAKAEYTYIADGTNAIVEPTFTFFGFRYVKITGWVGKLDVNDFTGCVVHSRLDRTGEVETSNPKVNRLFQNALWGQKGNFVDIPTDCPQRDERLGWTGDTMVFSGTACFNLDSAAFFAKYSYDLAKEQSARGGVVPFVVPAAHMQGAGSSVWGDVATVLPWTVYEFYGDRTILEQQFASMRAWVDFIHSADEASGGKRLWTSGFHFGDWLALDGSDPTSPMGGTPEEFIASAFYCHSSRLVARAAAVLGLSEAAERYNRLADEVRSALQREYFTPTGRLAINTQTGYVLALHLDLVPAAYRERVINDLVLRLRKDKVHLRTGFVGTPYLCRVLSNIGANDLAYRLLLNEDYPSWLYAVNLGATTIWERWNSLDPDGSISSTGMNSLNHYAYGSIVEWLYRDVCGLNPGTGDDQVVGFRHARIAPKPDKAFQWARATYQSAVGLYESGWRIGETGDLSLTLVIPFNATAEVVLPDAHGAEVRVNGQPAPVGLARGADRVLQFDAGRYEITYRPSRAYLKAFNTRTPIVQIVQDEQAKAVLAGVFPLITMLDESMLAAMGEATLREMAATPYLTLTEAQLDEIDLALGALAA